MKRYFQLTLSGAAGAALFLLLASLPALAAGEHGATAARTSHAPPANPHTTNSALREMKSGNQRFADRQPTRPNQDKDIRDKLSAAGQTPKAAVLGCSDSRAPVEMIFDQGFGDLFVVRDAGNVPGVDEIGSLEYAVEHLDVPLVVVLGHTKCGAVTAAVQGADEPGALGQLLARLRPAAVAVAELPADKRVPAGVKVNVELAVKLLTAQSQTLARAVREGRTKIIGAVYQLEDGRVIFFD